MELHKHFWWELPLITRSLSSYFFYFLGGHTVYLPNWAQGWKGRDENFSTPSNLWPFWQFGLKFFSLFPFVLVQGRALLSSFPCRNPISLQEIAHTWTVLPEDSHSITLFYSLCYTHGWTILGWEILFSLGLIQLRAIVYPIYQKISAIKFAEGEEKGLRMRM